MVPVEEKLASSAVLSGVLVVPKKGNAVDRASFAAKAGKYDSLNDEP
jgi:hypothetical protein